MESRSWRRARREHGRRRAETRALGRPGRPISCRCPGRASRTRGCGRGSPPRLAADHGTGSTRTTTAASRCSSSPLGGPSPEEHDMWVHEAMPEHPLMRWFLRTGGAAAMTVGRVPAQVASQRGLDLLAEFMRPVGLGQQLVIPYELRGAEQRVRPRRQRRRLLRRAAGPGPPDQPLLVVLARQYTVIDGAAAVATERAKLTGRELAVIRLLADGLTAQAIGRRLGVSPLTVRKHLENTYRKLRLPTGCSPSWRHSSSGWCGRTAGRRPSRRRPHLSPPPQPRSSPSAPRGGPLRVMRMARRRP